MSFHPFDPRYYPAHHEERPKLYLPSNSLLSMETVEIKRLLVLFYDRFRWREAFDNYFSEHKTGRAGLSDIYKCYVQEYKKTLEHVRNGEIVLDIKRWGRWNSSPMKFKFFEILLYEYNEIYLAGPPSPPRPRSGSVDMLPLWNKYDGFGDVRHLVEKSNPVLTIDRSPRHGGFGDVGQKSFGRYSQ